MWYSLSAIAVDLDGVESIQCLPERVESSVQHEDAEKFHRPQNLFVRDRLSACRHDCVCRFPVHVRQVYPGFLRRVFVHPVGLHHSLRKFPLDRCLFDHRHYHDSHLLRGAECALVI